MFGKGNIRVNWNAEEAMDQYIPLVHRVVRHMKEAYQTQRMKMTSFLME